jgi:protein ImuB
MFLAVHIPDFLAEAILRTRPELRHRALAVVEGTPPLCYVVALNGRAREAGLAVGMTKVEAEILVQRAGVVMMRDPLAEQSAHAAMVDAICAVSPRVEETAADVVVADANGLERLFGTPRQVARELSRRIAEQGLEANTALASNADNAEHTARGFMGVTVLEPATEAERIGALPLDALFAAEIAATKTGRSTNAARASQDERRKTLDRLARMQETLDRWGIRNFRGLAALPGASLSERLGRHGVRLQQLAEGKIRRELVLAEPAMVFEEAMELESAVENTEPLMFLLGRMIDQLCARLSARALCTHELRLRMKLERHAGDEVALTREELEALGDGTITERRLTLPVAMNDAKLFLKLLHLQLGARPPGAPVTQLWVRAEPARPRPGQAGLFMPLSPEPEKLELTLARIHKLLSATPGSGEELRAGCAELVDTHRPGAFRMTRFEVTEDSEDSREDVASSGREQPVMALRRLRPPVRAVVEMKNGFPARVSAECLGTSRKGRVVWAAGPWRTSGEWWLRGEVKEDLANETSQPWARDEWDVAIEVGRMKVSEFSEMSKTQRKPMAVAEISLFRMVREIESGSWWMEAGYD